MRRPVHIDEIRDYIVLAQQALARERDGLLGLIPPVRLTNREEYAFSYVRAERLGVEAIHHRAEGLMWLPLQIDPAPEMLGKKRRPMNRWILSYAVQEPDGSDFGNDFMHLLTRAALHCGWGSTVFLHAASRVAWLFHDLTCLLNAAYFLAWMEENGVEKVIMKQPDDAYHTVVDLARIVEMPETYIYARHNPEEHRSRKAARHAAHRAKKRPHLRVVPPSPDPSGPHAGRPN
jgi:hypothetical protein